MNDTTKSCVGRCGTRYVVTRRLDGAVELRYSPRDEELCDECRNTKEVSDEDEVE
jgi:hypothetical protein